MEPLSYKETPSKQREARSRSDSFSSKQREFPSELYTEDFISNIFEDDQLNSECLINNYFNYLKSSKDQISFEQLQVLFKASNINFDAFQTILANIKVSKDDFLSKEMFSIALKIIACYQQKGKFDSSVLKGQFSLRIPRFYNFNWVNSEYIVVSTRQGILHVEEKQSLEEMQNKSKSIKQPESVKQPRRIPIKPKQVRKPKPKVKTVSAQKSNQIEHFSSHVVSAGLLLSSTRMVGRSLSLFGFLTYEAINYVLFREQSLFGAIELGIRSFFGEEKQALPQEDELSVIEEENENCPPSIPGEEESTSISEELGENEEEFKKETEMPVEPEMPSCLDDARKLKEENEKLIEKAMQAEIEAKKEEAKRKEAERESEKKDAIINILKESNRIVQEEKAKIIKEATEAIKVEQERANRLNQGKINAFSYYLSSKMQKSKGRIERERKGKRRIEVEDQRTRRKAQTTRKHLLNLNKFTQILLTTHLYQAKRKQ